MDNKCPICNSEVQKRDPLVTRAEVREHYDCSRCGDYYLNSSTKMHIRCLVQKDNSKIAILSHWIRTKHEANRLDDRGRYKFITLDKELVENIIKNPPPSLAEQENNFVRWLGDTTAPGEDTHVESNKHQAIMGSKTQKEFNFVLSHLSEDGLIEAIPKSHVGIDYEKITLSFKGWEYYKRLKRGAVESRKAFMAMQYNDEQLDKIVEEVFKPAVKETGFDLYKLEDKPEAGLIDDRLRVEIRTSRFLIADLTHENANAYWEAGYAEGLGKPVIYTCEKKKFENQKTPFNTNHHLTVVWDANDPSEAAEELKATIRATLPGEAKLTDE
jgi:nucleoside 2-deoxyribosyltransferase